MFDVCTDKQYDTFDVSSSIIYDTLNVSTDRQCDTDKMTDNMTDDKVPVARLDKCEVTTVGEPDTSVLVSSDSEHDSTSSFTDSNTSHTVDIDIDDDQGWYLSTGKRTNAGVFFKLSGRFFKPPDTLSGRFFLSIV